MSTREEIVRFLNEYLHSAEIPDASCNGLQVEGRRQVHKIVFGVSASMELFKRAYDAKADMIVVHHGLLWGKEQPLTGLFGRRIGFLLKHEISLAAYHLPLDKHPEIGHNALLMKAVAARQVLPFAEYHRQQIGFWGQIQPQPLSAVAKKLVKACGARALILPFGPEQIRTIGAVSGGGWSMVTDAIALGLDLFVTGAVDEPVQELCREGKINCVALGHYNSEKLGLFALMDLVSRQFKVQTQFIDVPNSI